MRPRRRSVVARVLLLSALLGCVAQPVAAAPPDPQEVIEAIMRRLPPLPPIPVQPCTPWRPGADTIDLVARGAWFSLGLRLFVCPGGELASPLVFVDHLIVLARDVSVGWRGSPRSYSVVPDPATDSERHALTVEDADKRLVTIEFVLHRTGLPEPHIDKYIIGASVQISGYISFPSVVTEGSLTIGGATEGFERTLYLYRYRSLGNYSVG